MLVSGKESILDSIFCICCVPQEPESPLIKHRQAARHDIVQFLDTLAKDTLSNFSLLFNQRCDCRHNVFPSLTNPRVLKATDSLQQRRTPFPSGATQGLRQPHEAGLTSLP